MVSNLSCIGCFLLFCSFTLLVAATEPTEGLADKTRAAYIDAAILEAKHHARAKATNKATSMNANLPQARFSVFKKAPAAALAQGQARLMFEDMVNRVESKILQNRRSKHLASLQGNEAVAEELAMELFHKPGSLLKEEEVAKFYQESECHDTIPQPVCGELKTQKHRTADGTCNNLENPTYGAANIPFRRLIYPQYEDGIRKLRGTLQSQNTTLFVGPFSPPNPSPRIISVGVVQDRPILDDRHTHILMQWGQFLDHDLNLSPEIEHMCPDGCAVDDVCVPIPVPFDDRNVAVTRTDSDARGCHSFKRSLPACDMSPPGAMTAREQINAITSFIDGSQIYGSDATVMNTFIRDSSSTVGLLRVGEVLPGQTKPSLPIDVFNHTLCPMGETCYLAGDVRVNEQTGLIVIHTIWMREHNRIARLLNQINPHWDSDKIFLATREIVGAELQKITYEEYLPAVFGDRFSELIDDFSTYVNRVNPTVPNAFAAAAYRFGHSQIRPFFDRLDESYNPLPSGPLSLLDAFFNITEYADSEGTDPILRGLVSKAARKTDEFLNDILTSHLFSSSSSVPGLDLASLNIQRGRDHGLPPYLVWKRWAQQECRISSDFSNELTMIYLLQTYGTLETVDLFVGGLAEEPLEGGLVGATFACIFSRTFVNLRNGDRFFYKNSDPATGVFNAAQRAEIEKVSLSRVICDNSDSIQHIQPNSFLTGQDRVQCSNIPEMDLNAWREERDLPNLCYMKIHVENTPPLRHTTFVANSRLRTTRRPIRRCRKEATGRNADICVSFKCPEQGENGRASKLVLFPRTRGRVCSKMRNQGLPVSRNSRPERYTQWLHESHITDTNGIYLSEDSCSSGSATALDYSCSTAWNKDATLVQSLEEMLTQDSNPDLPLPDEDEDISADDPLFTELPKDIQDEILSDEEESEKPEKNDKLIGLLENVLNELKAQE